MPRAGPPEAVFAGHLALRARIDDVYLKKPVGSEALEQITGRFVKKFHGRGVRGDGSTGLFLVEVDDSLVVDITGTVGLMFRRRDRVVERRFVDQGELDTLGWVALDVSARRSERKTWPIERRTQESRAIGMLVSKIPEERQRLLIDDAFLEFALRDRGFASAASQTLPRIRLLSFRVHRIVEIPIRPSSAAGCRRGPAREGRRNRVELVVTRFRVITVRSVIESGKLVTAVDPGFPDQARFVVRV